MAVICSNELHALKFNLQQLMSEKGKSNFLRSLKVATNSGGLLSCQLTACTVAERIRFSKVKMCFFHLLKSNRKKN